MERKRKKAELCTGLNEYVGVRQTSMPILEFNPGNGWILSYYQNNSFKLKSTKTGKREAGVIK